MLSTCLLILQKSSVLICLLFIKMGKSRLLDLRYFHFRWLLSLACLHENLKWKHFVTGKCLRPWCILEKDSFWPWLFWTLVQLEPSEYLNPRHREGIGGSYESLVPPSHSASKGRGAGDRQLFPLPEQFNKQQNVSLLLASVLFQVFYVWICQKEKLCPFKVCV